MSSFCPGPLTSEGVDAVNSSMTTEARYELAELCPFTWIVRDLFEGRPVYVGPEGAARERLHTLLDAV